MKETTKPEGEKLLSYEELSEARGLKVSFLKKARHQMGLPCYKLGRLTRFKLSEFDLWTEQRRQKAS